MKRFLTILAVFLGMQATLAFANQWYCSTQSSRGYNYTWQSWDYNEAFRSSADTCGRYEYGVGYCYNTNCQQVGDFPPPPRRNLVWHRDVQSYRGFSYAWEDVNYNLAERGAVRACQQYERPYGGRCALPRCYQR